MRVGDSELAMPAERAAMAPVDQPWLPVSHAAEGQVPVAANLWGAGRRALPELDLFTPAAGVTSWLGTADARRAPHSISDTSARTIPANAEASVSAWGSTVRFSPAPTESARHSAAAGRTGQSASHAVTADVAADVSASAPPGAERRGGTLRCSLGRDVSRDESNGGSGGEPTLGQRQWPRHFREPRSRKCRRLGSVEEVHAAASAQSVDRQQVSTDTPCLLAVQLKRQQRPARRSTVTSRTTSLLNGRIAEQLDRRYNSFESSDLRAVTWQVRVNHMLPKRV